MCFFLLHLQFRFNFVYVLNISQNKTLPSIFTYVFATNIHTRVKCVEWIYLSAICLCFTSFSYLDNNEICGCTIFFNANLHIYVWAYWPHKLVYCFLYDKINFKFRFASVYSQTAEIRTNTHSLFALSANGYYTID